MEKDNLWHKKTPLIMVLIHALYDLPGCSCGGIAHVVTDDENVKDDDIKWLQNQLDSGEEFYTECIEKDLVKLLCIELLELTFEQRLAVFEMMNMGIDARDEEAYRTYARDIKKNIDSTIKEYLDSGYL